MEQSEIDVHAGGMALLCVYTEWCQTTRPPRQAEHVLQNMFQNMFCRTCCREHTEIYMHTGGIARAYVYTICDSAEYVAEHVL